MCIYYLCTYVPVALPVTMVNSDMMETNVVCDEVENGVQVDCAATDDLGCPSSSGSGDRVQDCTLTSNHHNVEQGTSSQKFDGDEQSATSSNDTTTVTSVTSKGGEDKPRYISKYLVQYIPDARPRNKETAVMISGAAVLTSEKCVAILKEQEEKHKQQQQGKERKRLEREQKKMEKEEEHKKKALTAERKALAEEKKALAAAKKAEE